MGFFGQQPRKDEPVVKPGQRAELGREGVAPPPPPPVRSMEDTSMATPKPNQSESFLAADLSIEGSIEGDGNIRVAGKFTGDVNVKGELTVEPGA